MKTSLSSSVKLMRRGTFIDICCIMISGTPLLSFQFLGMVLRPPVAVSDFVSSDVSSVSWCRSQEFFQRFQKRKLEKKIW